MKSARRILAPSVLCILAFCAWCGDDLKVVSRDKDGHGLLCSSQGKTLLFLEGSPQQMGAAHGRLLAPQVEKSVSIYYYLVGGAFSVAKDTWFVTHLEEIEKRCAPFVPERLTTLTVTVSSFSVRVIMALAASGQNGASAFFTFSSLAPISSGTGIS